jgi:carbamoyl-phosphate synthase large subunit
LITSAGRRVGLLNAVRQSLGQLGLDWRVIAADLAPELSAASQLADNAYRIPRADSDEYAGALLDICSQEDVSLVIPTIDTELLAISAAQGAFARADVRLNIGGDEFVRVARNKAVTGQRLAELGVGTPRTWTPAASERELSFPLIAKPVGGSSSIGIVRYASAHDYRRNPPGQDCVLQELLEGPEYTVNVFCDAGGCFRCAVPHLRIEVRNGEVSKGRTERRSDLTTIAERIASLPGARGAFCFQAILTPDGPVVFEINARFGGGYPLAHRAGATFTKWLLEETTGQPCTANDGWEDGLLLLRYDSEVFLS